MRLSHKGRARHCRRKTAKQPRTAVRVAKTADGRYELFYEKVDGTPIQIPGQYDRQADAMADSFKRTGMPAKIKRKAIAA